MDKVPKKKFLAELNREHAPAASGIQSSLEVESLASSPTPLELRTKVVPAFGPAGGTPDVAGPAPPPSIILEERGRWSETRRVSRTPLPLDPRSKRTAGSGTALKIFFRSLRESPEPGVPPLTITLRGRGWSCGMKQTNFGDGGAIIHTTFMVGVASPARIN